MGGEDPLALHPQVHEQQSVLLLVRQTGGGDPVAVQELEVAVELGDPSPEVGGGVSGMFEVGCWGGDWDGPVVCHGCSVALSSSGGRFLLRGRRLGSPRLGLGAVPFLLHRRRQLRCWVERGREKLLYWKSTDTQNEGKGSETAGHSYWEFPALGISAVHSIWCSYLGKVPRLGDMREGKSLR